jgi:hypothetical protein
VGHAGGEHLVRVAGRLLDELATQGLLDADAGAGEVERGAQSTPHRLIGRGEMPSEFLPTEGHIHLRQRRKVSTHRESAGGPCWQRFWPNGVGAVARGGHLLGGAVIVEPTRDDLLVGEAMLRHEEHCAGGDLGQVCLRRRA